MTTTTPRTKPRWREADWVYDPPCEEWRKTLRCRDESHNHLQCESEGQVDYPSQVQAVYPDFDVHDPRIRGIAFQTFDTVEAEGCKISKINWGPYLGTVHDGGACRLGQCGCPRSARVYGFRVFYRDEQYTKRDMYGSGYRVPYTKEVKAEWDAIDKAFCLALQENANNEESEE